MFVSMLFIPLYLSVGNLIGIVLFDNVLAGVLLQLSAVCVLPITMCNLTGSILNALNMEVKSFFNYILGSIALFLCLIIFTPLIGINSIIISFFVSMTIITLLNLRKIKKVVNTLDIQIISNTFKYSLIIAPSSLIGHFIANISLNFFGNFISAIIGGGTAIICVLVLCKMFNLFDLKFLFELISKKKQTAKHKSQ